MKLDLSASDSGKKLKAYLCDPRLQKLDISYWTDVPITSNYAAAVISHYLQTEHPSMALFDSGLFVGDLVGKRERFCSRLLVNALLAYAIVRSGATRMGLRANFGSKHTRSLTPPPWIYTRGSIPQLHSYGKQRQTGKLL